MLECWLVLSAVFVYFDDQGSWYDTPPGSVFFAFLFFKTEKIFSRRAIAPKKCYSDTEVLQLQPLSSNGCIICTVVSLNFNFFLFFSQPVENTICNSLCTDFIDQFLYLIGAPYSHFFTYFDGLRVYALRNALPPCGFRNRY